MSIKEQTFQLWIYIAATLLFSLIAGIGAVVGFLGADIAPIDIRAFFLHSFAFSTSASLIGVCFTGIFSVPLLVILNALVARLSNDFLIQTRITAIWLAANLSGLYFAAVIMLLSVMGSNAGSNKVVFCGMLAALVPFTTGMKVIISTYRQLLKVNLSFVSGILQRTR